MRNVHMLLLLLFIIIGFFVIVGCVDDFNNPILASESPSFETIQTYEPGYDPNEAPNVAVPMIMVDDVLYRVSENGYPNGLRLDVSEDEYLGKTTLSISDSYPNKPTENGQSNVVDAGTPYIEHENGILLLMPDGKWYLFDVLLDET